MLKELPEFRFIKKVSPDAYERILDYEKILNDTPPNSHPGSRLQTPSLEKMIEGNKKEGETLEDIMKDVDNMFRRRTSNALRKQVRRALSINTKRAASADRQFVHTNMMDDINAFLLSIYEVTTESSSPDDDANILTELLNQIRLCICQVTADLRGEPVDTGTEWFLYQTLVGAWPITADRLKPYMQKAMREAKLRTTWTSNNTAYEDALNEVRSAETSLADARARAANANAAIAPGEQPSVAQAQAAVDKARLDLSRTEVRAPFDGVIANSDRLQLGQAVAPGVGLLSLVRGRDAWIEANFKEKDLARMVPGQAVKIEIDAYPDLGLVRQRGILLRDRHEHGGKREEQRRDAYRLRLRERGRDHQLRP